MDNLLIEGKNSTRKYTKWILIALLVLQLILGFILEYNAWGKISFNFEDIIELYTEMFIYTFPAYLILIFTELYSAKMKISVYEDSIVGCAAFGKKVNLPMDSVTSISVGALHSIHIATASGVIKFLGIKNNDQIYDVITNIISKRQNCQKTENQITGNSLKSTDSNYESLSKLKELYDNGVITQEEFDSKKKQILGL